MNNLGPDPIPNPVDLGATRAPPSTPQKEPTASRWTVWNAAPRVAAGALHYTAVGANALAEYLAEASGVGGWDTPVTVETEGGRVGNSAAVKLAIAEHKPGGATADDLAAARATGMTRLPDFQDVAEDALERARESLGDKDLTSDTRLEASGFALQEIARQFNLPSGSCSLIADTDDFTYDWNDVAVDPAVKDAASQALDLICERLSSESSDEWTIFKDALDSTDDGTISGSTIAPTENNTSPSVGTPSAMPVATPATVSDTPEEIDVAPPEASTTAPLNDTGITAAATENEPQHNYVTLGDVPNLVTDYVNKQIVLRGAVGGAKPEDYPDGISRDESKAFDSAHPLQAQFKNSLLIAMNAKVEALSTYADINSAIAEAEGALSATEAIYEKSSGIQTFCQRADTEIGKAKATGDRTLIAEAEILEQMLDPRDGDGNPLPMNPVEILRLTDELKAKLPSTGAPATNGPPPPPPPPPSSSNKAGLTPGITAAPPAPPPPGSAGAGTAPRIREFDVTRLMFEHGFKKETKAQIKEINTTLDGLRAEREEVWSEFDIPPESAGLGTKAEFIRAIGEALQSEIKERLTGLPETTKVKSKGRAKSTSADQLESRYQNLIKLRSRLSGLKAGQSRDLKKSVSSPSMTPDSATLLSESIDSRQEQIDRLEKQLAKAEAKWEKLQAQQSPSGSGSESDGVDPSSGRGSPMSIDGSDSDGRNTSTGN